MKTAKYLLIILVLAAIPMASMAQMKNLKLGYTNVDYILSVMPESKTVESELKAYKKQLDSQLESKVAEFRQKYEAFEKGAATMTEIVREDKQRELQNMNASIEEFQQNAQSSLQKKEMELLQPVLDKIQKTIDKVAEENGYTYVFNSDAGYGTTPILLHGPEEDNISDLVLKKMGITLPTQEKKK